LRSKIEFVSRGAPRESRGFRVIVLSGPGAAAREVPLPRAFKAWLFMLGLASVIGSLFLGRNARAWVDDGSAHARFQLASEDAAADLEIAQIDLVHVPMLARLPLEPDSAAHDENDESGDFPEQPFVNAREVAARSLALFDINAKQALEVTPFDSEGMPNGAAFDSLKSFMRCRRSGEKKDMDPRLIALLTRISRAYGWATLQIISAHRKADGVVTSDMSQHVRGTAADIRIAGVGVEKLAQTAHEQGARGVGIYPAHRFVHVDVRAKPYSWRGSEVLPEVVAAAPVAEEPAAEPEGEAPEGILAVPTVADVSAD
jgi:uncharacterized protein YcbK (DUF882 family)